MQAIQGLTEREARARWERGEGNEVDFGTSRSYFDIARANIFNLFNGILIAIGAMLVALGRVNDALISIGPLFLANALIRTAQDVYAKRKLDRIALATRPKVTVIRDGQERVIDPADLVRGDVLHVRAGDQIVADGTVVGDGRLEMDESLLSGESDLVPKRAGDPLLSGSFCVAGDAFCEAAKVGAESYASRLTIAARKFELVKTPLQAKIDLVVRIVILIVALMSVLILVAGTLESLPFVRLVQISAVLTAQVPYGLFFMTVVAYALSAVLIAGQGAVVQQVNAVESLSNVDVLCMDKTGTLTANRLSCHALQPLGENSRRDVAELLGSFARSSSAPNRTSEAIAAGVPGEKRAPIDEVAFAASRKWSALAFDDDARHGVYVLGALQALEAFLPPETVAAGAPLSTQAREWSEAGLRVLVFAGNPDISSLHDERGRPRLPPLAPLGVISFGDELRAEARETIAEFRRMGIQPKIVSGDDPQTVAALARQAGLASETPPVSGPELAQMTDEEFARAATTGMIFGRIEPRQKEKLIGTLIAQGHYVAMIGDGVNDVLALKKAKLGIAMGSGSDATRRVADMVLIDDSFSALRPAFREGKRVTTGVTNAMCLFLTRVSVATLVIIAVSMLGLGFPFEPAHVALSYLTAGIPSFFLIIWAKPETRQPELLRSLARFVIPAAIVTMLIGVALYAGFYTRVLAGMQTYQIPASAVASFEAFTGLSYEVDKEFGAAAARIVAQTALSIFMTITAFLLILFLEPPLRFFTGWTHLHSDKRPVLLALALFASLVLIMLVPGLARYVALFPLGPGAATAIAVAVLLWMLALRTIWRARLFERFVSLDAARGRLASNDL
jgi:cation-transporting ATPase E